MKESYSTDDYIEMIAESYINGQKKQAVEQWKEAIADSVSKKALLEGLQEYLSDDDFNNFIARVI